MPRHGKTGADVTADAVASGLVATGEPEAQAFVDSHRDDDTSQLFGINELCEEFGISQRALRFYEDKELITPRRINNTRVYTRRDRARLALILRAKAIGSPLSEIKHYLDLYGTHGEGRTRQLGYVVERTDQTIRELEEKRAQIDKTLTELRIINSYSRKQMEERKHSGSSISKLNSDHGDNGDNGGTANKGE